MRFQIRKKNFDLLTMGELDREAAEFFQVPVDDKFYAAPAPGLDWFNWIGYAIARLPAGEEPKEWSEVIGSMVGFISIGEKSADDILKQINSLKPLIALCIHWQQLGYKPYSV